MSRRITFDLNDMAESEWDRIKDATGANGAQMMRAAFTLLRIYVDSRAEGKEFRIVKRCDPDDQVVLEMPI